MQPPTDQHGHGGISTLCPSEAHSSARPGVAATPVYLLGRAWLASTVSGAARALKGPMALRACVTCHSSARLDH
jgi:hypothetical protein